MPKLACSAITSSDNGLRPGAGTCNGDTACRDDFYSDPVAVGYYKDHVKMWLNRHNTFTGRLYRCARARQAGKLAYPGPCRLGKPETSKWHGKGMSSRWERASLCFIHRPLSAKCCKCMQA